MRSHWVSGAGGVRLFVAETGAEDAPVLLLIHGWSQCHLSWQKQLEGLSHRFRVVAPDLRGHGQSDKPMDASAYDSSAPWAEDIAAVISQLGLHKPVLAGWSMGGWIVGDYLRVHGHAALGAVAMVGSRMACGRAMPDAMRFDAPEAVRAVGMYGEDLEANLAATTVFVGACFAEPPSTDELAAMVEFNMLCPPDIRRWCRDRSEDYTGAFGAVRVPLLVIHGERDEIIPVRAMEAGLAAVPQAEFLRFERAGHAPFWEEPERFNEAMAAFAARGLEVAA